MAASNRSAAAAAAPELAVSRLIDAPRALVFKAWTSQEHAARWWGPRGFTIVSCRLDARPGGAYRVAMRSPEGTCAPSAASIANFVAPERLAFTYAWEDADGQPGHEMHVKVTFEAAGRKTLLILHQTGFESVAECDSHRDGWTGCFERFAEFITALSENVPPDRLPVKARTQQGRTQPPPNAVTRQNPGQNPGRTVRHAEFRRLPRCMADCPQAASG